MFAFRTLTALAGRLTPDFRRKRFGLLLEAGEPRCQRVVQNGLHGGRVGCRGIPGERFGRYHMDPFRRRLGAPPVRARNALGLATPQGSGVVNDVADRGGDRAPAAAGLCTRARNRAVTSEVGATTHKVTRTVPGRPRPGCRGTLRRWPLAWPPRRPARQDEGAGEEAMPMTSRPLHDKGCR